LKKPALRRKRVSNRSRSSAVAANIQQQLEELILEKKEKQALAKMEKDAMERRSRWHNSFTVKSEVA